MPRLILFRHAKAEPAQPGEKDHERALAARGRDDAAAMGKVLADEGEPPARVLCSTSVRTRQTWEAAKPALASSPDIRFLRDIYEADGDYIEILRENGKRAASLLLVGHNPAIHVTALRLADHLAGREGGALMNHFPTAALAVFTFDAKWKELRPGTLTLAAFITPKGGGSD